MPSTGLHLCQSTCLDSSYENTIVFNDADSQHSFFSNSLRQKYSFSSNQYQRIDKNKFRVQANADEIDQCEYMYFRNKEESELYDATDNAGAGSSGSDKWIYAFIKDVKYINANCAEIEYEVDVLQTYWFDVNINQCLIEREHVTDDYVGQHVLLENVPMGDIRCTKYRPMYAVTGYYICVATATDTDGETIGESGIYGGMPSALMYLNFLTTTNGISSFANFIEKMTDNNKADNIVSVWLQPSNTWQNSGTTAPSHNTTYTIEAPDTIDGYTPRNGKLFCYPYNYLALTTGDDEATYRYEWYDTPVKPGETARFETYGTVSPTPEILAMPYQYGGVMNSGTKSTCFDEGLILKGFPQLAWIIDTFAAWVANGGATSTLISGVTGALSGGNEMTSGMYTGALGAMMGNDRMYGAGLGRATGGFIQAASSIASTVNTFTHMANRGASAHGVQGASIECAIGLGNSQSNGKDFRIKCMQIQADYAAMIDDYFDKYGYLVMKIGFPDLYVGHAGHRPYWQYCKTLGANVVSKAGSGAPEYAVKKIKDIFDSGITMWSGETGANIVGSYGLDNSASNKDF